MSFAQREWRGWLSPLLLLPWAALVGGCEWFGRPTSTSVVRTVVLSKPIEAMDLSVPSRVELMSEPVRLRAPRLGWVAVAVRVTPTGAAGRPTLRVPAMARRAAAVHVAQVVSVPVDFDTAAYVRQSGEAGSVRSVPRVLLPLAVRPDGTVDLRGVGDGRSPVLVWVEWQVPATARAGEAAGSCDLLDGPAGEVLGSVPVTCGVADLSLADAAPLRFTAPLDWSAVTAADPASVAGVMPRLLNRRDGADRAAVAALDAYERLAHDHGAGLSVGQVQPIVKWPPGRPPAIDWADYDGLVGPWLDGSAFADRRPVGFWPVPEPDGLDGFDLSTQCQYRAAAAEHFDARRWSATNACPIALRVDPASPTTGPMTDATAILLSAEARATLDACPTARAMVPARADQVPLATDGNPSLVSPAELGRLLTRAVGGVGGAGSGGPSQRYLDAADASPDAAVLHGTGDEQDVRSTAWLAFLRGADVVTFGPPLPSTRSPATPVRAGELPWFYPGAWYGAPGPVPTLQLKFLRQAAQDYQVLQLAAAAGDRDAAVAVCRLIAKPVDVRPTDAGTASQVTLLGGTVDPHACDTTRDLLVDRIVARRARGGAATGVTQVDLRTVRWFNAHQRPTAFATGVRWTWAAPGADLAGRVAAAPDPGPGNWVTARVAVQAYDPSDPIATESNPRDGSGTWGGNTLQWRTADGWEPRPPAGYVPVVPACGVRPAEAVARFDLDRAAAATPPGPEGSDPRPPIALTLVDGDDGQAVDCPLVLPVAVSDRLARPVALDGDLSDWSAADAAQLDRPLVRMSSRPSVQGGETRRADHPTSLYTGWSDDDLYVAFRVAGVDTGGGDKGGVRLTRNFTEYRDGRAWGEDLTEVTVQPVYVDDTVGPALHVVCKTGGEEAERQTTPAADWQPFEGAALRYAATVDPAVGVWRGELAIPWSAIAAAGRGRPSLLRFNFAQHVHATGESATWAGPVDRSRDVGMAGLLVLRDGAGR